jgi:protein TonB
MPEAAPAAAAPQTAAPAATAPAPPSGPPAAAAAPQPAAAPGELSSSDVQPLDNPQPPYPALSRRLGESGTVIVRVLIGTDGRASEVRLQRSSGYDRLDDAALQAVRRWRWRPVVRNGAPQAMWFNQPVDFVLR